jgi:aspartate/methionine/tyrosine aminotransferase
MPLRSPPFALNARVLAVDAPPIPEAQAWRAHYTGDAGPMLDLSQAVPSAPPPAALLAALGDAARNPDSSRYGPILGDSSLRAAHASETSRLYGSVIRDGEVAITAGCNQAFITTMMALAHAGDSVILPSPWYFNHRMMLDMLGIEVSVLETRAAEGFIPRVEDAEALIRPSTRALVLVTPNNPTGATYPPETIRAFAAFCRAHSIALVIDETYRDFLAPGLRPHTLFSDKDWGETVISLYSFSKAYAIPGHRLGAIIAAERVMTELVKILDCIQICPARVAQGVVAEAIPELAEWREGQALELARRASALRQAFVGLEGWRLDSVGAYFAYAAHPFPHLRAVDVARRLTLEAGVLALPGSYFGTGQETHLRLAFANVGADALRLLAERLPLMR